MRTTMVGLFNLGGGEIVLIVFLLSTLVLVAAALVGLAFLIIHLTRKSSPSTATPVPTQPGKS